LRSTQNNITVFLTGGASENFTRTVILIELKSVYGTESLKISRDTVSSEQQAHKEIGSPDGYFLEAYRKAWTSFLKRVTGGIFTISTNDFIQKYKHKFILGWSLKKESQKLWKLSALIQKVLFWFTIMKQV
jgi:hypothetical protein